MHSVKRRLVLGVAAALLVALSVPSVLVSAADDRRHQRDAQIADLLLDAVTRVERDPECRPAPLPLRAPTFSDRAPDAKLLAILGILRRPQTAEERLPDSVFRFAFNAQILRGSVRIARSASGRAYTLVVGRSRGLVKAPPRRCRSKLRERFGHLLRRRPPAFRRAAERELERFIHAQWSDPESAEDGASIYEYAPGGLAGGGHSTAEDIRRRGPLESSETWSPGEKHRSLVSGLLPDGVATVKYTFGRVLSRGPGRQERYGRTVRRTVAVQDNVVSFTVPRPAEDAFPSRQVWLARDGKVLKVLRDPDS